MGLDARKWGFWGGRGRWNFVGPGRSDEVGVGGFRLLEVPMASLLVSLGGYVVRKGGPLAPGRVRES